MKLKEMNPTDKKTNHLIDSGPPGPAYDPLIPKTEDAALHPAFGREEKISRRPFPEDEDFREYYRLR